MATTFFISAGLIIFVGIYILIITEKLPNTFSALLGGVLMIGVHILEDEEAFNSVNWEVIFLLIGMMIIVNILSETGIFQWLSIKVAQAVKGEPFQIMCLLVILTGGFSALLDNVTTVLLLAPVSLLLAEQLELDPIPFLIAEIFASNIGGAATLIGDPPNIMIGLAANLTFNDFLIHMAPFAIFNILVLILTLRFLFGKKLNVSRDLKAKIMELEADRALKNKTLLKQCFIVLGFIFTGFVTHEITHIGPAPFAFGGAIILSLISKRKPESVFQKVEWQTIFFFVGLFIMVAGIEKVGLIEKLASYALNLTSGDLQNTSIFILWLSAIVSSIVDNIPYTATLIPMLGGNNGLVENIHNMHPELGLTAVRNGLWWSLALGACLGGNGTLIGSSANVVVANLVSRSGKHLSFLRFTKYGFFIMIESLILSTIYIWIRYL